MRTITLDVETVAPAWCEGERGWEHDATKRAPLTYHEPVVISWLCADTSALSFQLNTFRMDKIVEREVLAMVGQAIQWSQRLITFNGRSFDMPLLACRAMHHRVKWSFWPDWRRRFPSGRNELKHFDLLELLGDYGATRSIRLDRMAHLVGLPGKPDDIDGSQVSYYWFERNDREKVANYCATDVSDTFLVYLRYCEVYLGHDVSAVWDTYMNWAQSESPLAEHYAQGESDG